MTVIDGALGVLALTFLFGLLRAAIGPTLADRAAAADLCLFTLVAALALLSARSVTAVYIDVVLVATLLGFTATLALARLLIGKRR